MPDSQDTRSVTAAQARVLTTRADLLRSEARIVRDRRITWAARVRELRDYGRSGGSAGDRLRIVQAMAALEQGQEGEPTDG